MDVIDNQIDSIINDVPELSAEQKQSIKEASDMLKQWSIGPRSLQKQLTSDIEAQLSSLPEVFSLKLIEKFNYQNVIDLEKLEDQRLKHLQKIVAADEEEDREARKLHKDLKVKLEKLREELSQIEKACKDAQFAATNANRLEAAKENANDLSELQSHIILSRYEWPDLPDDLNDQQLVDWMQTHISAVGAENLPSHYQTALKSARADIKFERQKAIRAEYQEDTSHRARMGGVI